MAAIQRGYVKVYIEFSLLTFRTFHRSHADLAIDFITISPSSLNSKTELTRGAWRPASGIFVIFECTNFAGSTIMLRLKSAFLAHDMVSFFDSSCAFVRNWTKSPSSYWSVGRFIMSNNLKSGRCPAMLWVGLCCRFKILCISHKFSKGWTGLVGNPQ